MGIRGKLLSGFGIVIAIVIAFGIYVYNALDKFDEISDKKASRYEQLNDFQVILNLNSELLLVSMDTLVKYKDGMYDEKEFKSSVNNIFKKIFDYKAELLGDADTKEKKEIIKNIMDSFSSLEPVITEILPELMRTKASQLKFKKFDEAVDVAGENIHDEIEKLIKILTAELKIAEEAEATFAANLHIFLIVTIIAVVVISLLISIIVSTKIGNSIEEFQNGLIGFFKYLNRESNEVTPLDTSSNDEISKMAVVVNKNIDIAKAGIEEDRDFIDETVKVLEEFEQGDLCQRIDIDVSNPALDRLKNVLNSMGNHMEHNIDEILDVLEQYTHYNYLNKVETNNVKHHLLKLSEGVNLLGESITRMLVENKKVGLTLDGSSEVLLKNVNILNTTSNEAAASLEETAAALEEITSTIVNNTQSVTDMASFAHKVTVSVEEGQDLANQTTRSMDEINAQVTAINEAITVIDQIAFQTNILSLNAAVEAATAGEAGKGFAVVAGEVRNLASRSAEAASEIKALVENATLKTSEGKQISDKMIHGYTSLNENIKHTIDLINQVETASKEQKSGIEQINDAVSIQDRQTQQIASATNETYEIANDTLKIAKEIVENVDRKEFIGKDVKVDTQKNVLKKETPKETTVVKTSKNEEVSKKVDTPKPEVKKTQTKPVQKTESKVIESQTSTEDDEWESF